MMGRSEQALQALGRTLMGRSELEESMAGSLRLNELPEPVREYPFAQQLGRRWRFDFAWPEAKVALEVEGGLFIRSKHSSGVGIQRDIDKHNMATVLGWAVIRASNKMVEDNRAADIVRTVLMLRGAM